jgi:hypothetical protein
LLIHHTEAIGAAVVMAFHKRNKIGLYLKKGLGFFLKKVVSKKKVINVYLGLKVFHSQKRGKLFFFFILKATIPPKKSTEKAFSLLNS